jgi:ribulose-phosphate 3-epimerase
MLIQMAPSIMSADFGHLADVLKALEEGGADMLHLDVMDGHFAPNFTLGPKVLRDLRPLTQLPFDVHLAVEHPERFIDMFADAGANSIAVHVESTTVLRSSVDLIHKKGLVAGLALCPGTPAESVRTLLPEVDRVYPLTVDPGFPGQSFFRGGMEKAALLKAWIREKGLPVQIQVSGHITRQTAAALIRAGADILVLGAAGLFGGGGDLAAKLREFKAYCNSLRSI